MRVGERAQLVLVMRERLMVGGLPDLDGEQVLRDLAPMNDDVGIDRLGEVIVGRDDGAVGQLQRPLAKPVIVAIDVPAGKLPLEMHREAMGERALAEILLEQETSLS